MYIKHEIFFYFDNIMHIITNCILFFEIIHNNYQCILILFKFRAITIFYRIYDKEPYSCNYQQDIKQKGIKVKKKGTYAIYSHRMMMAAFKKKQHVYE